MSTGGLLGGSLVYRQLRGGHRSGFEPVLLAATVPARPGERVLEAGTGAGAALLCLGARVPEITGIGVERDPALASLANENFAANKFHQISAIQADATALPFAPDIFHHVLANPPWFGVAQHRLRPMSGGPWRTGPRPGCCKAGSRSWRGCCVAGAASA